MTKRDDHSYEQSLRDRPGDEGKFWRLVYGDSDPHFSVIIQQEAKKSPGRFNGNLNNRRYRRKK